MSKSTNIIIKCPSCSEKFEAERDEQTTFVSCPECAMQIKVSGTAERRGHATRKLMAKVNSLPSPRRDVGAEVSDLSFGRSLPFDLVAAKKRRAARAGSGEELSIDDDDDKFLKGIGEKKRPKVDRDDVPSEKRATTARQRREVRKASRGTRTPEVKAESSTEPAAKPMDTPEPKPKAEQAPKPKPKQTPEPQPQKEAIKSPPAKSKAEAPQTKPAEKVATPKQSTSPEKTEAKGDDAGDAGTSASKEEDLEKVQVGSRGERRRLKNAPKAVVPAPKGSVERIELERKQRLAEEEKLNPKQDFDERKVSEGSEWRRHKPSRVDDPDWEGEIDEEYDDDEIVTKGTHRIIVLGVGAAMALLGLWAGFQFMTARMGEKTPAAEVDSARPDIAVEARRGWNASDLLAQSTPIIEKFLASRSNEEALQYVRRANKVSFMMKKHYMPGSFTPHDVVEVGPPDKCSIIEDGFFVVPVTLKDFTQRGVALEIPQDSGAEWKVDWESFAGYSEMSFPEMRIRRPVYPVLIRCYLLEDAYYNYEFSDQEKYKSFRLFDHSRTDQMWGYLNMNAETYRKLAMQMVTAGSSATEQVVTLRVKYPTTTTNPAADQVEIVEFITFGWVVR